MAVSIVALGDVMLDVRLRPPRMFYYQPDAVECAPGFAGHFRVPFINSPESLAWLRARNQSLYGVDVTAHATESVPLEVSGDAMVPHYPFAELSALLTNADIAFANLECVLTAQGRPARNDACYRASPSYADGIARAPLHVVSVANNHAMDYGELGLATTLQHLGASGVKAVGAGNSLRAARTPAVLESGANRVAFLAYTMIGTDTIYATEDEAGVAPLNPMILEQDIQKARSVADCVLVSAHWGHEGRAVPFPRLVELAHFIIDVGADAILGHHPHVPGSIEIYHKRPILYSLGNCCFGHNHGYWSDDMLITLVRDGSGWGGLEIRAIGGRFQPALRSGAQADALYTHVQQVSAGFGTRVRRSDGIAVIEMEA